MCLAEALLRIPDAETADAFIADKIAGGAWEKHLGHSDSLFVNASTWGLMLTGRVVKLKEAKGANPIQAMKRLVARSGEPIIRQAVRQAVRLLGDQFVLGTTIETRSVASPGARGQGLPVLLRHARRSGARREDAERYFERYMEAIDAVGADAGIFTATGADADFRAAVDLGEAVGAASALRTGQRRAASPPSWRRGY